LNLWFANVFTIHPSTKHADGAQIENLKIHGLHHKMVEYVRMDKPTQSLYRNQFNAPLDASRILGDQLYDGQELVWSEAHYVGSALTDAEIALHLATDDWGEQGLLVIDDQFVKWTKGLHQWDDDDRLGHPYLGCNNDRMAHVPKGVIGIRMDGVENVVFDGLEISDVVETSALGNEVCGAYWDGLFQRFMGEGNTLQNAPYLYGYTGNRVHGIFSDWAEYTFKGDVVLEDFECTTGLIRGIGMYTNSDVTWDSGSSLKMKNFNAGSELYDENTAAKPHPYAPSKANPFQILWSHTDEDGHEFYSSISNHPHSVEISCIYGRDGTTLGVARPWWTNHVEVDNDDCSVITEEMEQKAAEWWSKNKGTLSDDAIGGMEAVEIEESEQTTPRHSKSRLVWSSAMLSVMAMMGFLVCVWETKIRREHKANEQSEVDPLIQSQSTQYI